MLLLAGLHPWLVPPYHLSSQDSGLSGSVWPVATLQRAVVGYFLLQEVTEDFLGKA